MINIFIYFIFIVCLVSNLINGLGPFPKAVEHDIKPKVKSSVHEYMPTNSWYENLLLGKGESAIQTYPYQVKAKNTGFCISYSGKSINEKLFVIEGYLDNVILSIKENMPESLIDQSTVDSSFYDLSAKVNYGSQFNLVLVRGSATVVANYRQSTPTISTIHGIINNPSGRTSSLKLQLNNGQTWLVQSESSINWQRVNNLVEADSQYTGWIKVSIVTSSAVESALNQYQNSPPITNGHVSYQIDRSSDKVFINLEYNQDGLFYLLPHVYKNNQKGATLIENATVKGIKGTYKLASGIGYQYNVPLIKNSDVSRAFDTEKKRSNLKIALQNDLNNLNPFNYKDVYAGGKQLARAARLIEVADGLNEISMRDQIKEKMTAELDNFWFGISDNDPALVFEPTWGGIVARDGVGDPHKDYGSYYYNDHHFHYGYHIYAAATLAKYYPDYYNSRKEYYNVIMADFAGTCEYKELPCQARAKDPFLMHSYASGLYEFADSRNQESSSEAINAYFAIRELGKNSGDRALEDLGDFLLSTEVMATQVYWHIKDTDIYEPPFSNNGLVGILWETKVDFVTFFGPNPEYIYGIQILPYTDITEAILDPIWLKKFKNVWGAAVSQATDDWKCFLLLADALIDPTQSGLSEQIHNLKFYDNGNSQTNTLYFYYMLDGIPIDIKQEVTVTPKPYSTPKHTTLGTDDDMGKPHPNCAPTDLGCSSPDGTLRACYDIEIFTCFAGGNLCGKPYRACVNLNNPTFGVPCYNETLFTCSYDGVLTPLH